MLKIKAARQMFFLMTVVQGLFCMEEGFNWVRLLALKFLLLVNAAVFQIFCSVLLGDRAAWRSRFPNQLPIHREAEGRRNSYSAAWALPFTRVYFMALK